MGGKEPFCRRPPPVIGMRENDRGAEFKRNLRPKNSLQKSDYVISQFVSVQTQTTSQEVNKGRHTCISWNIGLRRGETGWRVYACTKRDSEHSTVYRFGKRDFFPLLQVF